MSVCRTRISFVCWIALTTWADRTFDAWPPVYSRIDMSHALSTATQPAERHAGSSTVSAEPMRVSESTDPLPE